MSDQDAAQNGEIRRSGGTGGKGRPRPESERHEAARLLALGVSAAEAGRRLDIPERTVREWRSDRQFTALVEEMNNELVFEAVNALTGIARKAVITLGMGMDGRADGAQVNSARIALQALPQLREHALLERRIADLEASSQEETP